MSYTAIETERDIVVTKNAAVCSSRIVAFDPGQNIGWAVLGPGGTGPGGLQVLAAGIWRLDPENQMHACALREIGQVIERDQPGRVAYESSQLFGSNSGKKRFTSTLPFEMAGIIKAAAGKLAKGYMPATVKAFLGDGRMDKADVARHVQALYPEVPTHFMAKTGRLNVIPSHMWDAIAIATTSVQRDGQPW